MAYAFPVLAQPMGGLYHPRKSQPEQQNTDLIVPIEVPISTKDRILRQVKKSAEFNAAKRNLLIKDESIDSNENIMHTHHKGYSMAEIK